MTARFPYSPARKPPIPAVIVTLSSPDGSRSISAVSAHLDTAADLTVVPLPLIQNLGLQPVGRLVAHGFGGATPTVGVYNVSLDLPGVASFSVRVIAHPAEPFVLIGRDILNLFRVTFDGPNQVVEFH